ncbi:nickel transporter [Candidatus Methylacidiphilum infernorum]|uniref:High-affinity nickel transporter n=1 Tax=Methylacidiphilum infernorum (isolate V4) TaxID=481448 RepID=B3DXE3_METI4|nr:nickel transporter [Candidatus Methylacidiphilum infernorum]ACD83852.1 High-affinity nickel transporter [Methylacidiphilum infernorum V4]
MIGWILPVALGSGITAGFIHALSGPDHLAAIAPLVLEKRTSFWRIGLYWGIGHSGGVWILTLLLFLLKNILPLSSISQGSEKMVGIVLIGIGAWGLKKNLQKRVHVHTHCHDGVVHSHIHFHKDKPTEDSHEKLAHRHCHFPLAIGILHGFAGSNHFLSALPVLAFPDNSLALAYIIGFGGGSILGMICFSMMMGKLIVSGAVKTDRGKKGIGILFGLLAIAVGIFWVFQQ